METIKTIRPVHIYKKKEISQTDAYSISVSKKYVVQMRLPKY